MNFRVHYSYEGERESLEVAAKKPEAARKEALRILSRDGLDPLKVAISKVKVAA